MAKISNTDVMRSEANVKLAQDFIERNKGKTADELKVIAKNSKMSSSEKRQLLDYLEKNSTRELNKSLSYGDINNSEKLMGAIYDDTPSKQKASRKDILALSNTKYTNTLLEKILQTQNDTAMSENTLKYQQQVVSNLTIMQADIKQLVEFMKPKEVAETQAERKELEMGVSDMAKAMSNLDFNSMMKEFGKGVFKEFDTDGTGELLGSMLGMFKEQIQEGSFGSTIKDMIKEALLDRMPFGNELRRWKDDPVGFSQEMINRLGMSDNAGVRSLFKSHIKGMKPNLTPQVKKIDMSAAATFDNKVYTSLTRIIPEQLYKMVALLSGKEERRFDWEHQTYRNVSNMMADEYNRTSGKSLTNQVDNQMRELGSNIDELAASNKDIRDMLKFDANGKIVKDENTGMPLLRNRGAVRQVIANILSSGATLPDIIYGEPVIVIKQWRLNKGFPKNEMGACLDAVKFLKAYYNSLSDKDKATAIDDFKMAKQELDSPEISELMQSLDEDQRKYYQGILGNRNLTVDEMKRMFRNINIRGARVDVGPSGFGVGTIGGGWPYTNRESMEDLQAHRNTRDGDAELIDMIAKATGRPLTDKDKDDRNKFMADLSSGTDLNKSVNAVDLHDGANEFRTYASTNKENWDRLIKYLDQDAKNRLEQNVGVNNKSNYTDNYGNQHEVTLASIRNSIEKNEELTKDQDKVFKRHLTRLNRAMELYHAYDNAGLTASATARLLGVSPASVKNKLRGPEDLMEFINDDGTIDTDRLKAFTIRSGVDLSYISNEANESVEADYKRSQRGSISGGLKGSITNTLSAIFGDPKIANKAGIAVGSAAGLGIAQLLKNEGIISSPKAQYLLAAVGGGLMSMERTRKYMQNIFGPEGDIKNEQGYTNKEIFFAKAMQKYLPMVGLGGATFKYMNKALASFGPLGKVVGFPLALVTAGAVGAAAPSMVRALQRSLFDREKDDQSWMAKLGRFLKDVPFVKKYFDVTGIQSPTQIKIRSLESVKSQINGELTALEAKPSEELTPEDKRRITNLKSKVAQIEKVQDILRKDMENGNDGQESVIAAHDQLIKKTISDINKDYFTNTDGTLSDTLVDDAATARNEKENNYEDLFTTSFRRYTADNEIRSKRKNDGESVADMNYSNFYFSNTGAVSAGASKILDGLTGGVAANQIYVDGDLSRSYTYDELLGLDRATQDRVLDSYLKTDPNFVKAFKIYRDLKGYGIDINDGETIGGDVRETIANKLSEFIETNDNAKQMTRDIAADETDTMQSIIGQDLFNELMGLSSGAFDQETRLRLFDQWKAKVGEEKLNEIQELTADDAAKDAIVAQAYSIAEALVKLENEGKSELDKLRPFEIQKRAQAMVGQVFSTEMLTKRLNSLLKDKTMNFVNKMKTFMEPGNDDSDMAKHKEAMELFNNLNAGGKGTKSNTRVKMSELSDKKFKTGERLSVAGCSVAALNNALFYMGVTTVDVDTLITIANEHLTKDGGVSSDFFKEVGEKLGVEVTLYNNRDNTFTPESLMEVKPSGSNGLIVLLRNKDGNGYHYVTVRKIDSKNTFVDDPELNNSSTKMSTGDICVRAQELIVLKKVKDTSPLKENPLTSKLNQVKSVFSRGKDLLGRVQKDGILGTAKNIGKNLLNSKIINPLLNSTVPMTNMSFGDLLNGKANMPNTGDLVRGILDGLKDMVLNIRMVEDMTLPLKIGDPEAARAIASAQGMEANTSATKEANQKTKKLIANKDVSNALNEEDAMQDAVMTLSSLQNPGMVAGESTGAGGRGTAQQNTETQDPNAPHQSGPLASIKNFITGAIGTKGMGFLQGLGKAAGIAALGGLMYQGYTKVGRPMFKLAKDQFRRGMANLPIIGNRQEEEYQYDENGQVISGQHKDSTGAFRNMRDAANLTKVALGSVGAGVKGLEKVAKFSNSSIKVVSTVGKYADDILKNGGWVGKILVGIGKFCNTAISWMNKLGLGKIGFTANAGKAFLEGTKNTLTKWLGKLLPRMMQAGAKKGAEGFLKKLPLIGTGIALVQAGWSFFDAWRHSEAYTGVDPSKLEPMDKFKVAIAKAIYDAGMEFFLSFLNIFGGAGTAAQIGWSVLRATGIVRLDDIMTWFGVGRKELRDKVSGEDKKADDAKKKVDKDLEADEKKVDKENLEKDKKESQTKDLKSEYNKSVELIGESATNERFESKYGKDWQTKMNESTGDGNSSTSSSTDSSSGNRNAAVDYTNSQSDAARAVFDSFAEKQNAKLSPEELAELTKNLENNEEYKLWSLKGSGWEHPLKNKNAKVTSAYGPRNVIGGSSNHKGIDLSGTKNTPVFAMKDGEVIQNSNSYGIIKIKHDDGSMSRYVHMSKRFPKVGDRVKSGEQIGFVGGIGVNGVQQYGDHLHFEVYDKKGARQDPFLALGLDPGVFKLGPHGRENEAYLKRHAWLLSKSQAEADKLLASEKANEKANNKPEKIDTNTKKGDDQRDKKTSADLVPPKEVNSGHRRDENDISKGVMINMMNDNYKAIEMLANKFDQMIQLLSQIASSTGQISNNSMSDFNAPSVIR